MQSVLITKNIKQYRFVSPQCTKTGFISNSNKCDMWR